jgi:hypothetical protein
LPEVERPVPFEVAEAGRTPATIGAIVRSLAANAGSRDPNAGLVTFAGVPYETRTGRLRTILVLAAEA